MSKAPTGGPAFPRPASIDTSSGTLPDGDLVVGPQDGMALRDYFAASALVGLIAGRKPDGQYTPKSMSRYCYEVADAMLAARAEAPS